MTHNSVTAEETTDVSPLTDLPKHHGLLNFFLHTTRGLTILVSSFSVVLILMLGIVIFMCIKCLRRRKDNGTVYSASPNIPTLMFQEVSGGYSSKSHPEYSRASAGMGSRKMAPYKNIITPERTIEFSVPTVS